MFKTLTRIVAVALVVCFASVSFAQFSSSPNLSVPPTGGPESADYMVDDGTAENSIGITAGADVAFLNQFTAAANLNVITDVEIAWGSVADGTAATVYIWNDPNGDGSPADATVVSSMATTTSSGNTSTFVTYDLPDVTFNVGDNFFVGALVNSTEFPAAIDESSGSAGVSWVAGEVGGPGGLDVNNLGAAGVVLDVIDNYGFPGNWLVRANGTMVPEPASASLLVICGLALGLIRRR